MTVFAKALVLLVPCMVCNSLAQAESDIDVLIEQTGIVAGALAMRDRPGWRTPQKILIYRGWYVDLDLQSVAPSVEIVRAANREEALRHVADADAIIGSCANDIVSAAPRISWVQISGAGADRCMQTDRIVTGDVVLTNMQKMSAPMIGEHAIAMVLALAQPAAIRQAYGGRRLAVVGR